MATRDIAGAPLVPGRNVDRVDVEAGLAKMVELGFDEPNHRMEVDYNLTRWGRGEEDSADRSMSRSLSGVDYTSWRIILASVIATAERAAT